MPKPSHHIPRSLLIFLLVVIAATLLVGMFRAFAPAHAQAALSTLAIVGTNTPTVTEFDPLDTPLTQIPTLPPDLKSADTTGIIAQVVVLVVIIVFGAAWGWRMSVPHLPRKNEKQ